MASAHGAIDRAKAVKAGLGVTARPVEMMSGSTVAGSVNRRCRTRYVVTNPRTVSEPPQAKSLSQRSIPNSTY